MHKQLLRVSFAFAATVVATTSLSAQSATQTPPKVITIATCGSGLPGGGPRCTLDRKLLIDLRRHGAGAPLELNEVVHMGAAVAEVFRLTPDQATTADSTIYAVIEVNRDASGEYRVEESVRGLPATPANDCRALSTGKTDDLTFGAYLAIETTTLVRCTQRVQSRIGKQ